jgi:5-methylcytosine-specific restriction endonuclease McrA
MKYAVYLRSDHWRELRALKLEENPVCERCGAKQDLEVHHRIYRKTWYNTRLSDLQTLCHDCHTRHHAIDGDLDKEKVMSKLEHSPEIYPKIPPKIKIVRRCPRFIGENDHKIPTELLAWLKRGCKP